MERQRKVKILSIVALLIAILGLTIAFSTLSETLTINGTSTLDAAKWGIKFENLSSAQVIQDATINDIAIITENQITINNIDVSLKTPGDSVTYTVELVNEGTINAEIYSIEIPSLTEEQEKYIDFKVTYDNGEEVKQGDILNKDSRKNLIIKIEFKKDITESDLPKEGEKISLSYRLNFVQIDDVVTTTKPIEDTYLPNGYTKVEYLESNGTQYFQIPITYIPSDIKIKSTFQFIENENSNVSAANGNSIFGITVGKTNPGDDRISVNFGSVSNQNKQLFNWRRHYDNKAENLSTLKLTDDMMENKINYLLTNEKVVIYNEETIIETPIKFQTLNSMNNVYLRIFGSLRSDTGALDIFSRYNLRVYDGMELFTDEKVYYKFVTCLDENGIPCLYDLINKNTYYNLGSGEFLYNT